jgi:hypothetical protein
VCVCRDGELSNATVSPCMEVNLRYIYVYANTFGDKTIIGDIVMQCVKQHVRHTDVYYSTRTYMYLYRDMHGIIYLCPVAWKSLTIWRIVG